MIVAGRKFIRRDGTVDVDALLASRITQESVETLTEWRDRGLGPDWHVGPGGVPAYSVAGLRVWCEAHGLLDEDGAA